MSAKYSERYTCGCGATEEGKKVFKTCPWHGAPLEEEQPANVVRRLSAEQLTRGIPGVTPEAALRVRDRIAAVLEGTILR